MKTAGKLNPIVITLLICLTAFTAKAEWMIKPQFRSAFSFENDIARVITTDGKQAFINRKGEYVLGPAEIIEECSNGLYIVSGDDGKCAYFDENFVRKTDYIYEYFRSMESGDGLSGVMPYYRDGKYGILDKNGNEIIPPTFMKLNHFVNGTAMFAEPDLQWRGDNRDPYMTGTCGLVDERGNIIVPAIYYSVDNRSHPDYIYASGTGSYVTYDKNGSIVRDEPVRKYEPTEYADGYINEYRDGKGGVTAPDGSVIVPYVFSKEAVKKCGNVFVVGSYYVYDRTGNIIFEAYPGCGIQPISNSHYFHDVEYLLYSKIDDDGAVLYGLMDFDGNIICEPTYRLIHTVAGGKALQVLEDDRYCYTDLELNEITYDEYRILQHEDGEGVIAVNSTGDVMNPLYGYWYDSFDLTYKTSDWAKSSLDAAREYGPVLPLVYDFTQNITRLQFCETVYDAIGDMVEIPDVDISFADTESEAVKKLAALGIINGKADGIFAPFDLLTREEAAKILSLALEITGTFVENDAFEYADSDKISDWAKEHVSKLYSAGIMHGTGADMFTPKDNFSCEQSVAAVMRLVERISK